MLIDSRWIRKIALRITLMVPFLMYGSAQVLLAQGAQDYIVRFREGANAAARATVVRNAGAALGFNFHRVHAAAVSVPNARALAALQNDPSVLAVIPNRPVFAYQVNENGKGVSGTVSREAEEEARRRSFPLAWLESAYRRAPPMAVGSASRSWTLVLIWRMRTLRVRSTPLTASEVRPVRMTRGMGHM